MIVQDAIWWDEFSELLRNLEFRPVCFLYIAIIFFGTFFGILAYRKAKDLDVMNNRRTVRMTATILQADEKLDVNGFATQDKQKYWNYVLMAVDRDGRGRELTTGWIQWNLGKPGKQIWICCNPDDMTDFAVAKDKTTRTAAWVAFGLCMAFILYGILSCFNAMLPREQRPIENDSPPEYTQPFEPGYPSETPGGISRL